MQLTLDYYLHIIVSLSTKEQRQLRLFKNLAVTKLWKIDKLPLFSTALCTALVIWAATPLGGKPHLLTHWSVHYKALCRSNANLHLHDHDVPCVVCYVPTHTAKIMIPGTYICPNAWTLEYYGYLMAERFNHHRSTFECMDKTPEVANSGHRNHDGALFYHVEPRCGSLPCPPYDQQKEMSTKVWNGTNCLM